MTHTRLTLLLVGATALGCGARTGLRVDDVDAATDSFSDTIDSFVAEDGADTRDAGFDSSGTDTRPDATLDAPIDTRVDTGADAPDVGPIVPAPVTKLALGRSHTCVAKPDGTVRCWGWNHYGQLGDWTTTDRSLPSTVAALSQVVQIAAGTHHTCARKSDGRVACWGYNGNGEVGDGTRVDAHAPVAVAGLSGVTQLALGADFSCALDGTSTVWCWGVNSYGQLGDGTMTDRLRPTKVPLGAVVEIAAGTYHTCARLVDGTARCWGSNVDGQLGFGEVGSHKLSPTPVVGLSSIAQLSLGDRHSCARQTDGTVACWGSDVYGELGVAYKPPPGMPPCLPTPTKVKSLSGVSVVSLGYYRTCALRFDGSLQCYGYTVGESVDWCHPVDGGPACATPIVPALPPSDDVEIALGGLHACTRATDSSVRCWGDNAAGQVGDGTLIDRIEPVPIAY